MGALFLIMEANGVPMLHLCSPGVVGNVGINGTVALLVGPAAGRVTTPANWRAALARHSHDVVLTWTESEQIPVNLFSTESY